MTIKIDYLHNFAASRSKTKKKQTVLLFSIDTKIVNSYFDGTVDDDAQLRIASFLFELIEIRDGMDKFFNSFILSYTELCEIITYISTC